MTRAEDKYDLQLVKTLTDKPKKQQPWYKERFRSEHLKEISADATPSYPHLIGTEWTFVKDGLDDFRDGYPPEPSNGGLIKPVNGVMTQIKSYHREPKQQIKPNLTKHQVLYSKTLPGQERRREYLDSLIEELQQHPLALYTHIEQSVPPELFEDLVDTLDKDLMIDAAAITVEEYNNAKNLSNINSNIPLSSPISLSPNVQQSENVGSTARESPSYINSAINSQRLESSEVVERSGDAKESNENIQPQPTAEQSEVIDLLGRCDVDILNQAEKREQIESEVFSWPSVQKAKKLWKQVEDQDMLQYYPVGDALGEGDGGGFSTGGRKHTSGENQSPNYKWHRSEVVSQNVNAKHKPHHASALGGALTPAEDAHIQNVTKNFCEWVAELGGDSNNIDESTVTGLFSGGYESKPALSVPIHVVELTNVPPELRMNSAAPGQSRLSSAATDIDPNSKLLNPGYIHTKPTKAVRYGAWYLKPKQWKALKPGENITEPSNTEGVSSEAKKKSSALDHELANMHGAKEFIKFMRNKGNPVPDFLSKVAALQQPDESEEKGGGVGSGREVMGSSRTQTAKSRTSLAPSAKSSAKVAGGSDTKRQRKTATNVHNTNTNANVAVVF